MRLELWEIPWIFIALVFVFAVFIAARLKRALATTRVLVVIVAVAWGFSATQLVETNGRPIWWLSTIVLFVLLFGVVNWHKEQPEQ